MYFKALALLIYAGVLSQARGARRVGDLLLYPEPLRGALLGVTSPERPALRLERKQDRARGPTALRSGALRGAVCAE